VDPDDAQGRAGLLSAGIQAKERDLRIPFFSPSAMPYAARVFTFDTARGIVRHSSARAGMYEETKMGKAKESTKEKKKAPAKTAKEKKAAKIAKKHAGEATPIVTTPRS
jgi:hypothetical protein